MQVRTVIVDRSTIGRHALAALLSSELGLEVTGVHASVAAAQAALPDDRPDVMVIDGTGQMFGGIHDVQDLRRAHPRLGIVMLYGGDVLACSVIEPAHCCTDVVVSTRHAERSQLVGAIRYAAHFRPRHCSALCEKEDDDRINWCGARLWRRLSTRERQVLQHVVEGRSSTEIAELAALSPKSVQTYRTRIMRKLSMHDFAQLVRDARRYGLVPPG